tara:strand:- start:3117 stop:3377 length:261 start_codon:yes stop_codon:yes gene_type:complete
MYAMASSKDKSFRTVHTILSNTNDVSRGVKGGDDISEMDGVSSSDASLGVIGDSVSPDVLRTSSSGDSEQSHSMGWRTPFVMIQLG